MSKSLENPFTFVARGRVTRRRFVVAGAFGSAAVLTGGVRPALAADKPKIGLVMKSLANEFFKQMQAGAEKYAAANTDKFEFKAVGMKDERDFAAQVDAIENFVTQKYNIIVVAPADSKAMVTPIAKALKAGVKVINIDVELDKDAKKAAGDRPRVLRARQPRRREAGGRRARQGARAGRQGGHPRGQPRGRQRRAAQEGLHGLGRRRASCSCSTARPRIGRRRRPTR